MSDSHAIPNRRLPSFVPPLNRVVQRLVSVGIPMGPNGLLTVRGRTTGREHTFPVAFLEVDGRRFVQGAYGDSHWVRNLRAAGEAIVTKRGRTEPVDAIELPVDEAAIVLRDALARYVSRRILRPLIGLVFGFGPNPTSDDYREAALIHPMFELRSRPALADGG